jgi:hypothetical protein
MFALLIAGLVIQDPVPVAKAPLYDGAKDFAEAIEKAAKSDPKFLTTLEPFGTGYWYKRANELSAYTGKYVLQELIVCGSMIRQWNPKIGNDLREFALQALIEFPDRDVPELLKSDLRLEYVALLGEHARTRDEGTVLFDAGSRLGALSTQLMFAEFVSLEELKANAIEPMKQAAKFNEDRPSAPDALKRRFANLATLSRAEPFTVDTMKQVGLLCAEALSMQVPAQYRWKIPPDPPKIESAFYCPDLRELAAAMRR